MIKLNMIKLNHEAAKKTAARYIYESPLVVQPDLHILNLSNCYFNLKRKIKLLNLIVAVLSLVVSYAILVDLL